MRDAWAVYTREARTVLCRNVFCKGFGEKAGDAGGVKARAGN